MSDELKQSYEKAGRLHYYFDERVPRDLYRAQSPVEARQGLPILYPHPGYIRKDGSARLPDVKIVEQDGKLWVKGCRTISGDYRGISTFDKKIPAFRGTWYRLPKGSGIPEALAITQDTDLPDKANHFTIAPKDDMTLDLFQVWLNALGKNLVSD